MRLRLARLQAVSLRNMYSEHGLDAWIRSVFADVCQSLMVVSYWMPGVAAEVGGVRHAAEDVLAPCSVPTGAPSADGVGRPLAVVLDRVHELVRHADRVVGVLEEDAPVGLAGEARVVALLDEGPGLLLLVRLRVDELEDVRMVRIEDDHLGRAAGLAAGLDHAGEGVVAAA